MVAKALRHDTNDAHKNLPSMSVWLAMLQKSDREDIVVDERKKKSGTSTLRQKEPASTEEDH